MAEVSPTTHTPIRRLSAVHGLLGLSPSVNHQNHADVESGESSPQPATNKQPSPHQTSGGFFSSIQSMFSSESSANRSRFAGGSSGDVVRASEMGAELSILHRTPMMVPTTNTTHGKVFFRPIDRLPSGMYSSYDLDRVHIMYRYVVRMHYSLLYYFFFWYCLSHFYDRVIVVVRCIVIILLITCLNALFYRCDCAKPTLRQHAPIYQREEQDPYIYAVSSRRLDLFARCVSMIILGRIRDVETT